MSGNHRQSRSSGVAKSSNHGFSRRNVLSLSGAAALGLVGAVGSVSADDDKITNFGPGVPRSPILRAGGMGDTAYCVTYNAEPNYIAELDIPSFEFTKSYELPGSGAWALAPYEDGVYVGTYTSANLVDVNTNKGEASVVASFPDDQWIWEAQVADNGCVYASSYPNCRIYEYDPATGETQWWGPMAEGEDYARSVTVEDGKVYAGVGTANAHLIELDPVTGEQENILPDELRDRDVVYTMEAAADKLVAHVHPGDQVLALIDRENPKSDWRWIQPDLDVDLSPYFDVFHDDVYTSAYRPDSEEWISLRYDVAADEWTELGTIPNRPFPKRYVHDDVIIGYEGETIWKKNFQSGELTTGNAIDLGLEPGAEHPQSMTVFNNTPVVAGSGTLNIHDEPSTPPGQSRDPKVIKGGAEPKRMVTVGGDLYTASYTHARLYHYDNEGEITQLAAVGHEQNRPLGFTYQKETDMLLMGTRPDYGLLGGAISAYDRKSGEMIVDRNVIQDQSIYGVTSIGETAYLGSEINGGLGSDPVAEEARLAAWEPVTQTKSWEMVPVPGATKLVDLEAVNDLLFGVATSDNDTNLFIVDPESKSTIHTESVPASGLLTIGEDENLYGTLGNGVTEIDSDTFEMSHHASDLNLLSTIGADRQGHVYVIGQEQYELYQISITS